MFCFFMCSCKFCMNKKTSCVCKSTLCMYEEISLSLSLSLKKREMKTLRAKTSPVCVVMGIIRAHLPMCFNLTGLVDGGYFNFPYTQNFLKCMVF